jgi:hypothetical protein
MSMPSSRSHTKEEDIIGSKDPSVALRKPSSAMQVERGSITLLI